MPHAQRVKRWPTRLEIADENRQRVESVCRNFTDVFTITDLMNVLSKIPLKKDQLPITRNQAYYVLTNQLYPEGLMGVDHRGQSIFFRYKHKGKGS